MPGWLKALLTVAIVVVLLIVGVVGAGLFWWMRNKDALKSRMKEVAPKAETLARTAIIEVVSMKLCRATRKSRA